MADTQTTSYDLKLELMFVDEDTRTLTLKNPKSTITTQEIEALQTFIRTNSALIGDKDEATFGKISRVARIAETKRYLDFST